MPRYERCGKEVESMAAGLLREFETHALLLKTAAKIDYLFAYAFRDADNFPKGHALTLGGYPCLGIARILPVKQRVLGRGDAEVSLDGDWWADASPEQRRALLDHELHHLAVATDKLGAALKDDLGRPVLRMRKHDFDFGWFSLIAARHGAASQECIQADLIKRNAGNFLFSPETMAALTH